MDSMDYWVGSISPRCVVNIIYLEGTNTFFFESSHGIPVVLIPLENTVRELYFTNHKFSTISVNQLKAVFLVSSTTNDLSKVPIKTKGDF